uniref:Uncharacterized protein n=1 Tax=Candidatus Kentrum sp. FW TaxID=2126338 RepID=A0A450TGA3_9GAMM|nr:MAG: hypothetical protein BECKFW1821C_GA0114237_10096 [Candidatus Kentron sp. FW]
MICIRIIFKSGLVSREDVPQQKDSPGRTLFSPVSKSFRDSIPRDYTSIDDASGFLNAMGDSDNLEVQNQLVVGVLEVLADTSKSLAAANNHLEGRALALFERTVSGWGVE